MKTTTFRPVGLLVALMLGSACETKPPQPISTGDGGSLATDGGNLPDGGTVPDEPADYEFYVEPSASLKRVDALGVALTSTTLMNRDKDNDNHYQEVTPYVFKDPHTTVSFIKMLRGLHTYWHDQLDQLGFEPCSPKSLPLIGIPVLGLSVGCTLQKFHYDEGTTPGPRVIDAVLPDYVVLDFDEALRFPNGRPPWESISDKILAMGLLKMGGKCPGIDRSPGVSAETKNRVPRDGNGVPMCTVNTFTDIGLQVQENDRPFKKTQFPYLAEPWFYPPSAGTSYFWPWAAGASAGQRMAKPQ